MRQSTWPARFRTGCSNAPSDEHTSAHYTNHRIGNLNDKLSAALASTAAMSSLPQAFEPGQNMLAAGAGGFHGHGALALGISAATPGGRVVVNLKGSLDDEGDAVLGGGIGFTW